MRKLMKEDEQFICPMSGELMDLTDVQDEVFSSKMLGDGFAIEPKKGLVIAPFNGTVTMAFPTKHGIGLMSDGGLELLIHIEIDTVELEGKGFTSFVEKDKTVKQGEVLLEVNLEYIQGKGKPIISMFIFPNHEKIELLKLGCKVEIGELDIIKVYK